MEDLKAALEQFATIAEDLNPCPPAFFLVPGPRPRYHPSP